MRGFLGSILRSLQQREAEKDIESTYAYQAGYCAAERLDDLNPYTPGTKSHRHWAAGHMRQQRDAMTYW